MEYEGCWCHPKPSSSANTAAPVDDEIDIEREIAGPILIVRISDAELNRPNVTVVPRETIEIRFRVGHRFSANQ
jgi:hypothetical protein